MSKLFLKDENLSQSPPIVGYALMRYLAKDKAKKVSIYDVVDHVKDEKWFTIDSFYHGVMFLYATGLIDFQQPYLVKNVTA
ncbi:hypothetical protein HUN27_01105 [Agrobacterium tumefaciens]|nr:hypothetical protein [Agrobacterium tumefaciens]